MLILALVDYNNLRGPNIDLQADAELHAAWLVTNLATTFREVFPDTREIDIRLYGGWLDEDGHLSAAANRLLPILSTLRGRRDGVIVRPSLATALIEFADTALKGTVRLRTKQRRQKMVDGMLGCDALYIAAVAPSPSPSLARVALVTNDDDLVPAALSATAKARTAIVWMRPRPFGQGLNDQSLGHRGVQFHRI